MPELAEVDYFRKQWSPGIGQKIVRVTLHPWTRLYRDMSPVDLAKSLPGSCLIVLVHLRYDFDSEMMYRKAAKGLPTPLPRSGADQHTEARQLSWRRSAPASTPVVTTVAPGTGFSASLLQRAQAAPHVILGGLFIKRLQ